MVHAAARKAAQYRVVNATAAAASGVYNGRPILTDGCAACPVISSLITLIPLKASAASTAKRAVAGFW